MSSNLAVNAAVPPYLALFPLPNGTVSGNTGLYNFVTTQKSNEDLSTIHLDHNFSQKDSLHGTLLYDTASLDSADSTNTLYDEAISRRTTASLEEVHIFTSRLANSFRLGYNRSVAIAPNEKAVINAAVNNPGSGLLHGPKRWTAHRLRSHHRPRRIRLGRYQRLSLQLLPAIRRRELTSSASTPSPSAVRSSGTRTTRSAAFFPTANGALARSTTFSLTFQLSLRAACPERP